MSQTHKERDNNTLICYMTDDAKPDKSPEAKSAADLRKQLPSATVMNFTRLSPQKSPIKIYLLAHTDTKKPPETIGEQTPVQLAKQFAEKLSKTDKSQLTDIYLISCEAGMGKPSLAQQFAREMSNKGFDNLRVHAVAHPPEHMVGGEIAIINRPGPRITDNNYVGQIDGYFYANQESQQFHRYHELQRILAHERSASESDELARLRIQYAGKKATDYPTIRFVTDIQDLDAPY